MLSTVQREGITKNLFSPLSRSLGMVCVGVPDGSVGFFPQFVCFGYNISVSFGVHGLSDDIESLAGTVGFIMFIG